MTKGVYIATQKICDTLLFDYLEQLMSKSNSVFATIVVNKLGHSPHFCDMAKEHLFYLICTSFFTNFTSWAIRFHIFFMFKVQIK